MSSYNPRDFAEAFTTAGGMEAFSYSNFIRFAAIAFVILGVMWTLVHFMGEEAKASELFLVRLGGRVVRLVIGLTLFISLLVTKGR